MLAASTAYVAFSSSSTATCGEMLGPAKVSHFDLPSVRFDGVTKFRLPGDYFPNGVTVDPDGSVWFGEQNVPALGHLYSNGTMIEYAWPINYAPSTTSIWGVAVWHGRIWASDALGAQIVSLDPDTSMMTAVKLSNAGAFPYTITIGPDDALWFTELYGEALGRIDTQCRLTQYEIPVSYGGTPTQIEFQNSTYGYYSDAGNATNFHGRILSFNTQQFTPQPIDGTFRPVAASSLTLTPGGLWVAQHASSNLAYYSLRTDTWSQYPTTPVDYVDTTLPYFVAANGSLVWFNEHYANRIGVIDTQPGLLTEYSLSNPPARSTFQIDNALTLAVGGGRVWFTELTANYVGYVDATYKPSFSVLTSRKSLEVKAGGNVSLNLVVDGISSKPLTLYFADTENFTAFPSKIGIVSNETEIPSLNGKLTLKTVIDTSSELAAGNYTLLISVGDRSTNQGVYVSLQVTD